MPNSSVSASQFVSRNNVMDNPQTDFDIPRPGSANTWGSKRYTAWAAGRGGATPAPHSKETMGSVYNFSEE